MLSEIVITDTFLFLGELKNGLGYLYFGSTNESPETQNCSCQKSYLTRAVLHLKCLCAVMDAEF